MREEIIFAGFGGQGIMFMGKAIAYAAMNEGKCVTWIPSYGAEVRGGTAYSMVVSFELREKSSEEGLPLFTPPEKTNSRRGGGGQPGDYPERMLVPGNGDYDVHRKNTHDEGGEHNTNCYQRQGLDADVEVIADNRGACIHQAGEHL